MRHGYLPLRTRTNASVETISGGAAVRGEPHRRCKHATIPGGLSDSWLLLRLLSTYLESVAHRAN
jgi:hypothetical protein